MSVKLPRYLATVPERVLRAAAALSSGVIKEAADVFLPARFRRTRVYQSLVEVTLRYLIENVGSVEGAYPSSGQLTSDFLVRRGAGNGIEALGIVAFRVSPVWVLAALADVCGAGRRLIPRIATELQERGLLERGATLTSMDALLEGLEQTSARVAETINTPPLNVQDLRKEWAAIRLEARRLGRAAQPSPAAVVRVWQHLVAESERQKRPVWQTSSLMALSAARHFPSRASWLGASTLAGAQTTGRVLGQAILDDYETTLGRVRSRGYAAFAQEQLAPYWAAAGRQLSPSQRTTTDRVLDAFQRRRKR